MDNVAERVLPIIHAPFHEVLGILNREHPPNGTLVHLLSSSSTPLYTALILLTSSSKYVPSKFTFFPSLILLPASLSSMERTLVESLSQHIPIIILPPSSLTSSGNPSRELAQRHRSSHLSSFHPASLDTLRTGLFRTPSVLATLRTEAASRFLRWREVERAVERVQRSARLSSALPKALVSIPPSAQQTPSPSGDVWSEKRERWDKEAWEAQWEGTLSQEVALHLRRRRSGSARRLAPLSAGGGGNIPVSPPCAGGAAFDPLHLPSLVVFSFSLVRACGARVARAFGIRGRADGALRRRSSTIRGEERPPQVPAKPGAGRGVGYTIGLGLALVGAFCAGIGIGLVAATGFRL